MFYTKNYQKLGWIILGFIIACSFMNNVHALDIYVNDTKVVLPDLPTSIENNNFIIYTVNNNTVLASFPSGVDSAFWFNFENPSSIFEYSGDISAYGSSFDLYYYNNNSWVYNNTVVQNGSTLADSIIASSLDIYGFSDNTFQQQIVLIESGYGLSPVVSYPDYLDGYIPITLETTDRYYMLDDIDKGSIFIPIDDFLSSGGRLSYYDNDLSSQPYTSYIQDYTITPDGLYARQDFDLSNYYGADWVMFSKYLYLEGTDNITYDIWIPEDMNYSSVTITPNSSGGNDFSFQYTDSNGDIQNKTISSIDLTPPQPLLSDVFQNFTTNYYGLSSIILSPISFLESVNNATCTPLNIPSPVSNDSFTIPCMTTIYETYGGDFFTLYQTITTGFIAYYVGLGYFNLIKGLKDPSDDRIEVIHL